eukprot:TRINITY_DN3728_c0_g2_i2.p1 TRINITY_DN3728_c0_g2~~TRINITY_DN3728_c0_g2_i2.p1  ORF type:complete len:233 (-),score=39.83 TRINITY_DN3728_c0_g2_i2:33-731(-)
MNGMNSKVDSFIIPGDVIGNISDLNIRIGPGLIQNKEAIIATKPGVLRYSETHKFYWIENNQKRYVPAAEDMVIGIVTDRYPEHFNVDIGGSLKAKLPSLAFEGATKSNHPNLEVGSLVYARVSQANKDIEPELMCMSLLNKSDGFGELLKGYMFKCSLGLSRSLLQPESPILQILGRKIPYEGAVGMNGRVWVKTDDVKNTIIVDNSIINSKHLTVPQMKYMVNQLIKSKT